MHISKILFLFPDPSGQKPILVEYKTDNNGNFPGKPRNALGKWNPPPKSQFKNAIALKKWVVLDTAKVRDNEWDSFLDVSKIQGTYFLHFLTRKVKFLTFFTTQKCETGVKN